MLKLLLNNKILVTVVGLSLIAIILYAIYGGKKNAIAKNFYEENKSDDSTTDDLTISDSKATSYVKRLIYDAGNWPWQEDIGVYNEIIPLSDSDLKRMNNIYLSDFSDIFDDKYISLRSMVSNENLLHTNVIRNFLVRTDNLF